MDSPASDADPRNLHMVDGILHHIRSEMGPRIHALLPHFESLWATGWGERANEHLILMFGMPAELEVVEFEVAPSTVLGVEVPAGSHEVRIAPSRRPQALAGAVALLAVAVAGWVGWRRPGRAGDGP